MADIKNEKAQLPARAAEKPPQAVAEDEDTREQTKEVPETAPVSERPAVIEKEADAQPAPRIIVPKKRPAPVLPMRDEMTVKIEKIMEEGLGDAFQNLSPVAKEEFKLKGEKAAGQIRQMLNSAHIKIKKIFRLIYEWLKILPGINRFFLEQEAKIKADKIIALKKKF